MIQVGLGRSAVFHRQRPHLLHLPAQIGIERRRDAVLLGALGVAQEGLQAGQERCEDAYEPDHDPDAIVDLVWSVAKTLVPIRPERMTTGTPSRTFARPS